MTFSSFENYFKNPKFGGVPWITDAFQGAMEIRFPFEFVDSKKNKKKTDTSWTTENWNIIPFLFLSGLN